MDTCRWAKRLFRYTQLTGLQTRWQKRLYQLQSKYGFFADPVQASSAREWEREVRKKVRDQETQQWLKDAQLKTTLGVYVANKRTIGSEARLYDNSLGSRLLFEARAGALRTLSYRRHFYSTVTTSVCRVCGAHDETVAHIVLQCAGLRPSRPMRASSGPHRPSVEATKRRLEDWYKKIYLSVHLSVAGDEIQLNYVDSRKQKHWLKVHLSPEFPAEAPTYDTDLPVAFEFQWHKGQTLAAVFEAFARQADRLVPFWEAMADLDVHCWVLDPSCPRAGDTYRRIALGKAHGDVSDRASGPRGHSHDATLKKRLVYSDIVIGSLTRELTLKAQGEPEKFQRSPEILTRILGDLEHCGWHNLGHLSVAGDEIQLNYVDSRKQKHWLKVHLSPEEAPTYDTDLPVAFEFQWHKGQTLAAVFEAFARQADRLVPFWEAMADLDVHCWVLDPSCPRAGDTYRRIALGKNVSVMVVIDPHTPMTLPRLEFTGPEAEVSLHEKALQDNADRWHSPVRLHFGKAAVMPKGQPGSSRSEAPAPLSWQSFDYPRRDPSASISANLSALLGFKMPSRENATSEEVDCACGICYSFLLDGAVPDKLCQNSRCSRPFHQSCLSEWMRSLPMVRQNFNMFFGECPYCSEEDTNSAECSSLPCNISGREAVSSSKVLPPRFKLLRLTSRD
ncbi:hypothetical protein HPB47_024306 [Ixodes persulcatus]|uniref:Uncharacterized protein n=1 Tax=Ixodes persulcatus TaxID=34615 RepID=A0AC60Q4M0_IXOPE|nr:hypothetical protein HPB47_024306 [Ixodes persulcatus]